MYCDCKIKPRFLLLVCLFWIAACSDATHQGAQGNETLVGGPESFTLTTADGFTVYGHLHRPDGFEVSDSVGVPLILAFHQGGASGEAEYAPIIPRLLRREYAVLTIDQRRGGDRFMGYNQTAAAFDAENVSYCDAYNDLEAAFAYALTLEGIDEIIAWGSSYSATLAVKLAVNHPELISRVLAFSPASGEPMTGCSVLSLAFQLQQPALFLRPKSEMSIGSVAADLSAFARMGHEIYIASPGAHGSSMLVSERVEGNTSETWNTVIRFLDNL